MRYIVSYDIPDDKRRTKMAKILLDFGKRIQYSVFECLLNLDQLNTLEQRLKKAAKDSQDNIRIYRICGECENKTRIIGKGKLTEDPERYIV